jgi:transposase
MSQSSTLDSGWDVHQDSMAVAYVAKDHGAEGISLGTSGTRHADIDQRIRNMQSKAPHRLFVDEAGPCGDWLYRSLTQTGHRGWVVAPALSPTKAGDRWR